MFITFQFQMPCFIRYTPLKSEKDDALHYANDFAFDNQEQINSSNKTKQQKNPHLSNTALSDIHETVLIYLKLCY